MRPGLVPPSAVSSRPDPEGSGRTILSTAEPSTRLVVDLVAGRPVTTDDVDWSRAVELLTTLGLRGLAVSVHRSAPYLPGRVADALESAYLSTALHTTLTVEAGRRAVNSLAAADVPVLLLKGAALVEAGVYRDPGARAMDDADLLVPADRATDAVFALRQAGFEPWLEWDPGTVDWLDSATFTDTRSPREADVHLDLHWRLGYEGLRYGQKGDTRWLWADVDPGRRLPSSGAHLVVVAQHVLKHFHVRVHLPGILDLVRLSDEIDDWTPVRERLERHRTGRSVTVLLGLVRTGFDAAVPPDCVELAGSGGAAPLARRLLGPGALLERSTGGGGRLRGLLLRWLLAGSVRSALGEVGATVLPGPEWLRARYGVGEGEEGPHRLRLLLRYWREVVRWLLGRGVSPVSPNQEFER